jgi:putative peptidoglycan lipid II flippase
VLGVFAVSVATVILPTMSQQAHRKDFVGLKDSLRFSVALLAFITIPASIGVMMLGEPLIRLLFQFGRFDAQSTDMTSFALYFHASGIFFIAMQRNVVQVFYSMKDLLTPTLVAGVVMVLHAVLAWGLAKPVGLGLGGVALAGSLGAAVNAITLYALLRRRLGMLGTRRLAGSLGRTAVATVAMALTVAVPVAAGVFKTPSRLHLALLLIATVLVAMGVYFVAARALRSEELSEFTRLVGARLRRRRKK